MQIRIAFHYDFAPGGDLAPGGAAPPDLVGLLDHAERAEQAGAGALWVAERATGPGGVPSALPVCAALLSRTRRVHVGTAVLPLALHHPLRVAEDGATLDLLSGGRFELGVGLGGDPEALPGFGVATGERARRLEEAVQLVRAAWCGGPVHFAGHHYQADGIEILPAPLSPGGPPIWVGAGAPSAQARAARIADGLLLAPGAAPDAFLQAWGEAGRPVGAARLAVLFDAVEPDRLAHAVEGRIADLRKWAALGSLDLLLPVRAVDWDPGPAIAGLLAASE